MSALYHIFISYLQGPAAATTSCIFKQSLSVWGELIYFHRRGAEFPEHAVCLSAANICWLFHCLDLDQGEETPSALLETPLQADNIITGRGGKGLQRNTVSD